MAKRDKETKRTNDDTTSSSRTTTSAANAMERRVVAFAEQVGRIAGTVQARTEGWMDRETLNKQIASIRDSAADLLKHLGVGAKKASKRKPAAAAKGRSGGVVDAPGKKHRKPLPADPRLKAADTETAKMGAAKMIVKPNRLRGRGRSS